MRRYFYLFLLFCVWNGTSVYAQMSITATGVNFTQDFNSMGSAIGPIPGGFRAGASTNHTSNGTSTTRASTTYSPTQAGGCYNFSYPANPSDRALGFLNSSSYSAGKSITLEIVNNTGTTINNISLDWNYEKYRSGNRAWDWTFYHGSSSAPSTVASAGNQAYPTDGTNSNAYNPPLITSKSVLLSGLSIAPGASYYFRWTFSAGGNSNGQAIGIDDFVINCTSNAPACPPGSPSVALGNDTAFCAGTPFFLLLDAGNAGASFDWNNGAAATQTFTATQAGTYVVEVDSSGCIARDSIVISALPLPVIPVSGTASYCAGSPFSMTLDAGNPGATYNWENGASAAQTYTVNIAGTYSVSVTDANGCVNSDSITITENQVPVVNIGPDTSYCAGQSFFRIYDAGNAGSTYSWNGGTFTGQTFIANLADTYTVTVTNAAGCSATDSVIVTEQPVPVIMLGSDTAYCAGSPFSWTLDAGNSGASFDWNNGAAVTQTFVATQADTYKVTVTAVNGCVASDSVIVTENPLPQISLHADTAYCAGQSFLLSLDAANPGAVFDWNNGAASTQTFDADTAGIYQVQVTDNNGCMSSDSMIVTENALPFIGMGSDTSYCSAEAFAWILDAGNPGASYDWNNGTATTQTFTVTQPGTYTVVVTDINGCINTDSVIVTGYTSPVIDLGTDVVTTSQTTVIDGPAGFVSYNWSNGQSSASVTVTQSGTYSLTVTDTNGCTATDVIEVLITFSNEEAENTLDALVYPNPADSYLRVRLNENVQDASLVLYNMAGQAVYRTAVPAAVQNQELSLDLVALSGGMYILKLEAGPKSRSFKIMIRK